MSRTRFTATALVGVLALAGAATSVAAPAKKGPVATPACGLKLAEQIPNGETAINPADTQGSDVGTVKCGKLLGSGLASMAFTVPDSGNLVGTFKQYFATGSMHGKFMLVPDATDTPPATTTFAASSYTGTLTLTGGTGTYQLAKGTGTITCHSADSIHMSCLEHLKLTRL